MTPSLYALFFRVRSLRGFVPVLLRKLLGMKPRDDEFAPQRMCPSCGLITPRSKRYCLECGESLRPA